MTGAPIPSTPTPANPRFWKSPFFWAAIFGVVLIPLIRPLMRRVPPPPPVSGQIAPFEFVLQGGGPDGRPFGSRDLKDHVYLAHIDDGVGADCAGCEARLDRLRVRCERMGVKLTLVGFFVGEAGAKAGVSDASASALVVPLRPGSTLLLRGRAGEMTQWVEQSLVPHIRSAIARAPARSQNDTDWAVLVDGDGGVRGAYALDEDGLDEIYHRAQHVMSLRPAWR